jgi:phage shock protein PspC (stress-responsive transcriptional regulator)
VNGSTWFGIGAVVVAVWGVVIAVFNRWAQSIGGDELMNGRPITPTFVRVIGVFLAVLGTGIAIVAFSGLLPTN